MKTKKKLLLGLGFLFLIIIALVLFCSFNIERLSREADNILKDNYNSLVYSRNMMSHLDDLRDSMSGIFFSQPNGEGVSNYFQRLFESGQIEFDKDLKAESNNITEIHEKEYLDLLVKDYAVFLDLCSQIKRGAGDPVKYYGTFFAAYEKVKHSIHTIYDLNMQAIVRKNQAAQLDSKKIVTYINSICVMCVLLAFAYFWYFPFYVSNTLSILAEKMQQLLKKKGIQLDVHTEDETYILWHGLNLLDNELSRKKK